MQMKRNVNKTRMKYNVETESMRLSWNNIEIIE